MKLAVETWDPKYKGIDDALSASATISVIAITGTASFEKLPYLRQVETSDIREVSSHVETPVQDKQDRQAWPDPISEEGYQGLLGDIVKTIEPHSEADPAGMLLQLLVAFGNNLGRNAYYLVESTRHYLNLFLILGGATAGGRKGTGFNRMKSLFSGTDLEWAQKCVMHGGLASGEGLVWALRDPIERKSPVREGQKITGYQDEIVDHGISDKRLLIVEEEFASVLSVQGREGSTLSAVLRNAWDHGSLENRTKNSPAKATNAHVSIIGHITSEELRQKMAGTEAFNGYGNRFLWACVKRSKLLPDGGNLEPSALDPFIGRLREVLTFSRSVKEIKRNAEAREIWHCVYRDLTERSEDMAGAMTARAAPQVMRLACLYALSDCSDVIQAKHMMSALAVWEFCEQSAKHLFGSNCNNPLGRKILTALHGSSQGLTRTEIIGLFQHNRSAAEIDLALNTLLSSGTARSQIEKSDGRGRPTERWLATKKTN